MRADEARLQDILLAAKQIQSYIAGQNFESFASNSLISDAVVRQIEIIGEAATHVSEECQQAYPEIPWRKMSGMRNILIHQYEEVDLQQVWMVATIHLPVLIAKLETS